MAKKTTKKVAKKTSGKRGAAFLGEQGFRIHINNIVASKDNPRKTFTEIGDLWGSIDRDSLFNGLVVVSKKEMEKVNKEIFGESLEMTRQINPNVWDNAEWILTGGGRRYRAIIEHLDEFVEKYGETLPCTVYSGFTCYSDVLNAMSEENKRRVEVNVVEEAFSIQQFIDERKKERAGKYSHHEAAEDRGISLSHLQNLLRILTFETDVIEYIREVKVDMVSAGGLNNIKGKELRAALIEERQPMSGVTWNNLVTLVSTGFSIEKAKRELQKKNKEKVKAKVDKLKFQHTKRELAETRKRVTDLEKLVEELQQSLAGPKVDSAKASRAESELKQCKNDMENLQKQIKFNGKEFLILKRDILKLNPELGKIKAPEKCGCPECPVKDFCTIIKLFS